MDRELVSMYENDVWILVHKSESNRGKKVSCRWVFSHKEREGKEAHKAKLVARRFSLEEEDSFRLLLSTIL